MKQVKNITLSIIGAFCLLSPSYAQEKCATTYLSTNKTRSVEQFEQWMDTHIKSLQQNKYGVNSGQRTTAILQIPVVVHVIHNGENIGFGANISEAQILSQIEVLNEDFRRQNADAVNTPDIFQSIAADVEIEFILAIQDPTGLPTDGIVRVEGSKSSYHPVNDQSKLASESYWPAEDYFNIWVTTLQNPYLGYAQFPISDLPGLEDQNNNRLTDGVVIHYRAFGSKVKDPNANLDTKFNLGRTTTHEVGHFLGLRHIWGDGNCNTDDFVNDTPVASQSNSGLGGNCTFPGPNSCGSGSNDLPDMFQNFMDYTDDRCMNLFTLDQKARMHVVMTESPRRASLLTSPGLVEPTLTPLNLELRFVTSPVVGICDGEVEPKILVRNYGETTINSATIEMYINGSLYETKDFTQLNLVTYESDTLFFGESSLDVGGNIEFVFQISSVNGTADNSMGNAIELTVPSLEVISLPVVEDFENFSEDDWQIVNPDNGYTWSIKNAPMTTTGNKAIGTSFFDDENSGSEDYLISTPFYITEGSRAVLAFDVAYARYRDEEFEGLKIAISTDCGNTYPHIVFEKYGVDLETAPPLQSDPFKPSGVEQWRKEIVDLSPFAGNTVRISFIAVNEWGNNLYLDNISILDEDIVDISLTKIIAPTPGQCEKDINPSILLTNLGNAKIADLQIEVELNNITSTFNFIFPDSLQPSEEIILDFPEMIAKEGINKIAFTLLSANSGGSDHFQYNNYISREFLIDYTREELPLREDFDDFSTSTWHILNLDSELTWQLETSTSNNKFATFPSAVYLNQKDEDWILSPVLDFSDINEAALFFDLSYSGDAQDRLQVLYTTDCGFSYHPTHFDKRGEDLSTYTSSQPKSFGRQYVSLNKVIGYDNVRLAIVATSGQGSDIDIDNIEIFLTDNPLPPVPSDLVAVFPNPTDGPASLSFNLDSRETVMVQIFDNLGRIHAEYILPNTLNQTHTLELSEQPDGIYFIKIRGQTFQTTKRLVIY